MKKVLFLIVAFISISNLLFGQIRYNRSNRAASNGFEVNYANPKEYEIAEITVTGSDFLDHNALISISGLKIGDRIRIPGEAISGAIRKLWGQGIIGDVSVSVTKIEDEKVYLNIDLKERPRLSRFKFEGINKTQQSELNDKVKLIRGRVLTDAIIKNAELSIKKHFVEKGFLNTEVKVIQEKDSLVANSVQLRIIVNRNNKVRINKITFEGNERFSDTKLKGKLKSTNEHVRIHLFRDLGRTIASISPRNVKNFIARRHEVSGSDIKSYINENVKLNFFKTSKFIRNDYKEDKEKLIAFYNSKGYRDAIIVEDTVYKHDKNTINLEINIDEGKKYYFRDIIWSGNYVYEDKVLAQILGVEKGDIYDMELINKRLNYNPTGADISSLYMDDGYLFFNIQPVEVRVEGDSIDVEMRIFEGTQATINKIVIKGNDRTNDHVILREIRTLPGQKFSRTELIRTQRELSQLGYFDPEKIGINPVPNPNDGTVDIEYSLEERPSDQIELSGGWGGMFGFVGTLGLVFNNFSIRNIPKFDNWRPLPVGDGQRLALRLQANGPRFQMYSLTFTEPWLGGRKPNALTFNLSHSVQRNLSFQTNEDMGSLKATGGTISLGRRVRWPDDFFTMSNSLSFMHYNLDRYTFLNFGFPNGTGSANNFTFNNTIARNSIDNPMYPRQGYSLSLSASFTPPYSLFRKGDLSELPMSERFKWMEFHKWMFDGSFFLKIVDKLVLNSRAHMGFIGAYDRNLGVGPFERFFLGGDGIAAMGMQGWVLGQEIIGLRGYPNRSITPGEGSLATPGVLPGGTIYNKFVFELRYPLSLNPAATIYGLAFMEGGNNWNNFNEFNPQRLYKSAGIGARIFMPAFGLIGVDWGYGFDTLPGTNKRSGPQFHFTIGQQIR
jgi:outer membrane protein insertion porin family